MVEQPSQQAEGQQSAAALAAVAMALGMDPNAKIELQKPDLNYIEVKIKRIPIYSLRLI